MAQAVSPATLDPARGASSAEKRLLSGLYEGLTALDPQTMQPYPAVAQRWEVSPDGTVWIFHLRKCAWSNGQPVTADDFVYAWQRLLDPHEKSPNAYLLFAVNGARAYNAGAEEKFDAVGIKAFDARTLRVTLAQPIPLALYAASPALAPVPQGTHGKNFQPALSSKIITNGPFTLTEFEPDHILLTKSRSYWDQTAVYADQLTIAICDEATAWRGFAQGRIDVLFEVPLSVVPEVPQLPDCRTMPAFGVGYIALNAKRAPFDDPLVREAFDLAIDKELLARYVLKNAQAADRCLPPGVLAEIRPASPLYDPARAANLLARAAPPPQALANLQLLCTRTQRTVRLASALQKMWRKALGVEVSITFVGNPIWPQAAFDRNYDIFLGRRQEEFADPALLLNFLATQSLGNAGYISAAAPPELLKQAENALLADRQIIPLYHPMTTVASRKRITGITPNAFGLVPLKNLAVRKPVETPPEQK